MIDTDEQLSDREIAFTRIACVCDESTIITSDMTAVQFMEDHHFDTGHVEYTIDGYVDDGHGVDGFERDIQYGGLGRATLPGGV